MYLTLLLNPVFLKLSTLLSEGLNSDSLCPTDSLDTPLLIMWHLGHIRGALVLEDEYSVLSENWALYSESLVSVGKTEEMENMVSRYIHYLYF